MADLLILVEHINVLRAWDRRDKPNPRFVLGIQRASSLPRYE